MSFCFEVSYECWNINLDIFAQLKHNYTMIVYQTRWTWYNFRIQGDSGGPAQAEVNGKWTLIGVTSWGHGCGDINSPGAYTKVTSFITWIENNKWSIYSFSIFCLQRKVLQEYVFHIFYWLFESNFQLEMIVFTWPKCTPVILCDSE